MPGEGIESQIKQIERYIKEEGKHYLSEEEYNQYSKHKEQFKQRQNESKYQAEYYELIKGFEIAVRSRRCDKVIDKQGEALDRMGQRIKKVNHTLDMISKNSEARQKIEQQCGNLLKKESTTNRVLILFFVFAAVATTALICYAIFSHPSYVLDNVTVRESMRGISL
ncbi:hypothetical protein [Candidatus Mesenet endosymbiont of Agriotes lineatus]|uniref:hypothetical protein n=1 Tax=Candidatus Mesenet endosymbiont of Agriotes lineatus TaxID=3077948 RepID=UPI0030D41828